MRTARVIGHRGAAGHAPENTLAAVRAAAALGTRWVEFDAKLSRDGAVVLFHDETLERTTDGRGRLAEQDLATLKALDAGGWFAAAFRGERIPTLGETIATLGELGLGANVEIKPDPGREVETAEAVIRILKAEWPAILPPPLISSFRAASMATATRLAPQYPAALLVGAIPSDWRRRLEDLGCDGLHCDAGALTREQAREVLAAGCALRCYTVNESATARMLFAWGVEAVFSDYPERIG
ncbi:MAG: glycerophosphodiester phosphodiesterase [Rhodospirillales bacterium]